MNDAQTPPNETAFDRWFKACQQIAHRHGLNLCHLPPEHWSDIRRLYRTSTPPSVAVEDLELLF